jgi:hypothetical protein
MCVGVSPVTGYGQEADRQQAIDAGFEQHLKPVDLHQLEQLIASRSSDWGSEIAKPSRPATAGPSISIVKLPSEKDRRRAPLL